MLRMLQNTEEIHTEQFGGFCPYWTIIDGQVLVSDTFENIIQNLPLDRRIVDPVGFLELLQFNYMLGNRTLIRGVHRMPWRSTLRGDGSIERQIPLPHDMCYVPPQKAAKKLRELLVDELYNAAKYRNNIYILLTGGFDSRVVAGILKSIESQIRARIACVSWGLPESRDVTYARRIAEWYDWEFINIPYNHSLVWANIERGAIWGGSEVAGIHLHGTEWFNNADKDDLVVAASFGDMIGRAEFSSVHLKDLSITSICNRYKLIHPSLEHYSINTAILDRKIAWELIEKSPRLVRAEFDMAENYMRRMICHAMDYIRQYCNLHQAFTSDAVVSYMWSLSPESRTNEIYYQLLMQLDNRLSSLPWARTGVAPDGTSESDKTLLKEYHELPKWLYVELEDQLESLFFSTELQKLGLLYMPSLKRLWKNWRQASMNSLSLGQDVVKICSLEITRRHFNIQPCRNNTVIKDRIRDIIIQGVTGFKKRIF